MEFKDRVSITFRVSKKFADLYHQCAEAAGYSNLTAWIVTALNERVEIDIWRAREKEDQQRTESETP